MRAPAIRPAVTFSRCAWILGALCLVGWDDAGTDVWQVRPTDPSGIRCSVTVIPGEVQRQTCGEGVTVSFRGQAADRQAGAPDIGGLVKTIPGRPGFRAVVHLLRTEFRDEADVKVLPAETTYRRFVDDNSYRLEQARTPDPAVYANNAFWPPNVMRVTEAWMGTNRYVRLVCTPAQYNPVKRLLRVHSRIEAELDFVPDEGKAGD